MNLPLAKLNRDELYTFIVGFFTALAWHLYFQEIGFIAKNTASINPTLIFAWLFITGLVYIFYTILIWVSDLMCKRKIKSQNDDEELKKMNLKKYLSFFWSGPLEEQRLFLHIYGLLTISLIFVYHPVASFTSTILSLSWFTAIHITYSTVTIAAYLMLYKQNHYLHQVNNLLDKNYCDTLDQTTYLSERAAFYAKVKNDEFFAHYLSLKEGSAAPGAAKSPPKPDTA